MTLKEFVGWILLILIWVTCVYICYKIFMWRWNAIDRRKKREQSFKRAGGMTSTFHRNGGIKNEQKRTI